jgi:hypothetical protein
MILHSRRFASAQAQQKIDLIASDGRRNMHVRAVNIITLFFKQTNGQRVSKLRSNQRRNTGLEP